MSFPSHVMDGTDPFRQQPQMTMATTLIPHQTTSIPINPQEFVGLQQSPIQPTIQQASIATHHHQGKLAKVYCCEWKRVFATSQRFILAFPPALSSLSASFLGFPFMLGTYILHN